MTLRDGVSHLPPADERVGRAFVLGLLGHYVLDRAVHPFVVSQQRALCAADPSLEGASGEVHALIESDIDSWILWERCSATVEERPAADNLMRTERIEHVGGALFSQMALAVFGVPVSAREYVSSVRDYERLYRLIDPARSALSRAAGTVERMARGVSRAEAMAHYVRRSNECPAANLECRPWEDPFTGEVRHESVADLFDEARLAYPAPRRGARPQARGRAAPSGGRAQLCRSSRDGRLTSSGEKNGRAVQPSGPGRGRTFPPAGPSARARDRATPRRANRHDRRATAR